MEQPKRGDLMVVSLVEVQDDKDGEGDGGDADGGAADDPADASATDALELSSIQCPATASPHLHRRTTLPPASHAHVHQQSLVRVPMSPSHQASPCLHAKM